MDEKKKQSMGKQYGYRGAIYALCEKFLEYASSGAASNNKSLVKQEQQLNLPATTTEDNHVCLHIILCSLYFFSTTFISFSTTDYYKK